MSKDNSDYKRSLRPENSPAKRPDDTEPPAFVPGSREDSMRKQGTSKKKQKK